MRPSAKFKGRQGFTLIELSIVLVIIGLVTGGILVGRDLIRAAEIRATVAQIEKYNTAVNTFRSKYGGLPGDIIYTQASAFGFYSNGMTGTTGLGNGNGIIEATSSPYSAATPGEIWVFWRHLSEANLIDGTYASDSVMDPGGTPNYSGRPEQLIPPAKLGRGNYFYAYGSSGINYFEIEAYVNLSFTGYNQMTPKEAHAIDSKLDDGMPNTGTVRAQFMAFPLLFLGIGPGISGGIAASDTAGACTLGTFMAPLNAYDVGPLAANVPACGLQARFN